MVVLAVRIRKLVLLIGYDLPGTLGWDYAGFLITSQNTAQQYFCQKLLCGFSKTKLCH